MEERAQVVDDRLDLVRLEREDHDVDRTDRTDVARGRGVRGEIAARAFDVTPRSRIAPNARRARRA